jgi:RNA polymerase sigma-70 factor (ECF subfamily)
MPSPAQPAQRLALEPLLAELHTRSGAAAWDMGVADFARLLTEIASKNLGPAATDTETRVFLASLRVEELALARACAAGHEKAWEVFLTRYRARLYEMALNIAREASAARDLADSIYASLYGLSERAGQRVSKLSFYAGRGSLEGWLRTVLAQEFVNRYRKQRHAVSLEEKEEEGAQFVAATPDQTTPADARLEQATDEALAQLPAEDRYVLAAYYLDERTLAEIARTLGVHESTISRRLERLARALRKQIVGGCAHRGMSRRQAEEALAVDVRDLRVNVRRGLAQDSASATFSKQRLSARTGEAQE